MCFFLLRIFNVIVTVWYRHKRFVAQCYASRDELVERLYRVHLLHFPM